jgi:hypothetical protein
LNVPDLIAVTLIISGDALFALLVILGFIAWQGLVRTVRDLTDTGAAEWSLTSKAVPRAKRVPAPEPATPAEPADGSPVPGLREAS